MIKSTLRAMQGVRVPLPRRSVGKMKRPLLGMPGNVDSAPIQRRDSLTSTSATYEGTRPIVNEIHDRAVVGALLTLVTGDSRTTLPGPTGYTAAGKLGNLRSSAKSPRAAHSSEGTPGGSTAEGSESSSCPDSVDVLSAEVRARLDSVLGTAGTEWQFDAFRLQSVALQQNPLSTLGMHCIVRWSGLAKTLGLHERRLARFLVTIEGGYLDNPYHYRTHAADVLQTACMIWAHGGVRELPVIGDLEGLGLMIGAAVHDYEHPGYNNAFLVGSGASLLLRCVCAAFAASLASHHP